MFAQISVLRNSYLTVLKKKNTCKKKKNITHIYKKYNAEWYIFKTPFNYKKFYKIVFFIKHFRFAVCCFPNPNSKYLGGFSISVFKIIL